MSSIPMVRGLDYYNHTIFLVHYEVKAMDDGLVVVAMMVWLNTSVALRQLVLDLVSVERILLRSLERKALNYRSKRARYYIAVPGDEVNEAALNWFKPFESKVSRQNATILDANKAQFKSAGCLCGQSSALSSEVESLVKLP